MTMAIWAGKRRCNVAQDAIIVAASDAVNSWMAVSKLFSIQLGKPHPSSSLFVRKSNSCSQRLLASSMDFGASSLGAPPVMSTTSELLADEDGRAQLVPSRRRTDQVVSLLFPLPFVFPLALTGLLDLLYCLLPLFFCDAYHLFHEKIALTSSDCVSMMGCCSMP